MATVPAEITWVAGSIVTAAQLNANLRDAINFLIQPPLAILRNAATKSLSNATFTAVLFDTEEIDRDGGHSTVTNTSRYTAQTAGYYRLDGLAQFVSNSTGRRLAHWAVNGTALPTGDSTIMTISVGGGNAGVVAPPRTAFLNVGDYAELLAFQDSGGALNIATQSYMGALWVSS